MKMDKVDLDPWESRIDKFTITKYHYLQVGGGA